MGRTRSLAVAVVWILLTVLAAGPAAAETVAEPGGVIRHIIMVPLLDRATNMVVKTVPIIVEIHADTDPAKNYLTDRMATIQDAYMQAAFGKLYTDVDYGMLLQVLGGAVDDVAGPDYKGQYTVTVQVNVKPK